MKKIPLALLSFGLIFSIPVSAISPQINNALSQFRNKYEISNPETKILNRAFIETYLDLSSGYVIYDTSNEEIVLSQTQSTESFSQNNLSISEVTNTLGNIQNAVDDRNDTFVEFEPIDGKSEFILEYDKPITTEAFRYSYASNVSQPNFIQIELIDGEPKNVYDKVYNTSGHAGFPQITGKKFRVSFYHNTRLQISELDFDFDRESTGVTTRIEWLARPGAEYELYTNPETYYNTRYDDRLSRATDIPIEVNIGEVFENELFTLLDTDGDGVSNVVDNCPDYPNPDQIDQDSNNLADICEDRDLDSIVDFDDNCLNEYNPTQVDKDKDGLGDKCDEVDNDVKRDKQLRWLIPVGFGIGIVVMTTVLAIAVKNSNKD